MVLREEGAAVRGRRKGRGCRYEETEKRGNMGCRYRLNFEKRRRGVGMRGLRKCGASIDELGEREKRCRCWYEATQKREIECRCRGDLDKGRKGVCRRGREIW